MKVSFVLLCLGLWGFYATAWPADGNFEEGISNAEDLFNASRVNGGHPAQEPVPYQASLQVKRRSASGTVVWRHMCGGAVISERHVLTAAHCMQSRHGGEMSLVVGTLTWHQGGVRHRVVGKDVHPEFSMQPRIVNDIAVLTVDPPFNLRLGTVRAVQLGRPTRIGGRIKVRLTGWGSTTSGAVSSGGGGGNGGAVSIPQQLQMLDYETITNDQCRRRGFHVSPTELCAYGGVGRGACVGDSGGPLVTEAAASSSNAATPQLVGLVSYGTPTCARGRPDVYTRVSSFLPFINKVITAKSP